MYHLDRILTKPDLFKLGFTINGTYGMWAYLSGRLIDYLSAVPLSNETCGSRVNYGVDDRFRSRIVYRD